MHRKEAISLNSVEIGKRLKALRGTQAPDFVAESLGISRSALFMYERGERVPRDEIKIRIARFYNCSVEDIFFTV